jgi:hypothetical protein
VSAFNFFIMAVAIFVAIFLVVTSSLVLIQMHRIGGALVLLAKISVIKLGDADLTEEAKKL